MSHSPTEKSINAFYFGVAFVVALVLPLAYLVEDYLGEKEEVAAWAEFQASALLQALEEDPYLWPFKMRGVLETLKNRVPDDDDDETAHSVLDIKHQTLVVYPAVVLPPPVLEHKVPIYHFGQLVGYYQVERSLRGSIFETLVVALGGLLLAFIIAFPLRAVPLRALHQALNDLEKEKERVLITLQSIGDAVIATDANLNVESLNPIAESFTGWKSEQAKGKRIDSVLVLDDLLAGAHQSQAMNRFAINPDEPITKEKALLTDREGVKKCIDYCGTPIRTREGTIAGFVIVFTDITERIRIEEVLRSSQVRANNALRIADLGTFERNLRTEEVKCSARTREIFGFSENEGNAFSDYLDRIFSEDRKRVKNEIEPSLANDGKFHTGFRIVLPNGEQRHVVCMGTTENGTNGAPKLQTGVFSDVTEYRNNEERLKEADERKDEFIAVLAHELRNPLAPINAAIEILRMRSFDEHYVRQTSEIIERQVNHINSLVEDLLDISRIRKGIIKIDKTPVDLHEIARSAVEQVSPLVEAKRHHLELLFAPGEAKVLGDKKRLMQVVANLLGNAAKYTPEGGRILLKTEVQKSAILLDVFDNGIGISPELLPHIFDSFSQGERTSDRSSAGLGLGLSVVKALVELHGGEIVCSSEGLGKGSRFHLSLSRLQED
jgi:PAS domain S-box-containing protein